MTKRLLLGLVVLLVSALPYHVQAQDSTRYENALLGIAFDLPAGWEVVELENNRLLAAAPFDLQTVQEGGSPSGLTVRFSVGTFNQLGIADATELPNLIARLVSSDVAAPAPAQVMWGNASGYEIEVTMPDEGLTTKVGMLAIEGGRVAVVRGIAPTAAWESGGRATFDALAQSMQFSLPQRDEDLIATVISNDGGVFWQYQEPQPDSGRIVVAGVLTYDEFDVMYLAVGPGGVLALDMKPGTRISYIGPWVSGNFVDVAIGPDTKLYLANIADTDDAIMVVDRAGNYNRSWGARGDGDGEFAPGMPLTLAVTKAGDIWTVSEGHSSGIRNRLYKFDAVGNLLLTVDLDQINPDLKGIRLDNNVVTGALYLVGETGNLNVVDSNGQALVTDLAQEVLGVVTPLDITIEPNDNIVIAVPAPGEGGFGFLELSVAGKLLDVFGLPYDTARGGEFKPGEYSRPGGMVVGRDGTIYFAETNPDNGYTQVQAFVFTGDGILPLGNEAAEQPVAAEPAAVDASVGGGSLTYGETKRGTLNNRYPYHNWTFEAKAGDHIVITMIDASGRGELDPKISLRNAEGIELSANDDVGDIRPDGMSSRDALLDYAFSSPGVYTIQAGRFGGRGEYILTLELVQ